MSDLIGQQIENYRVEALLGEGGMGAVYQAFDVTLTRKVALKVMHRQLAKRAEFQQRFMQEAQAAARLGDHPSIVNIYNFAARQELLFMVMEFVPGASLGAYIKHLQQNGKVVKLSETLLLLAQVAEALGYAHRNGVVHRDIKPDNVLLKPTDTEGDRGLPMRAIVTDFGLAKLLEGGVQTQTGTFMGTLPYMSPEQCLDKELDGRSDLYSLGIMLFQLATGQLPFNIKSPTDAVVKHIHEEPPDARKIRPGVPMAVENIIKKSIAKDPDARFQSGNQMAAALRKAAGGLTDADVTHFAAPQAVVSVVTDLLPADLIEKPSRFDARPAIRAGEPRIMVARQGEAPWAYPVTGHEIRIGRSQNNELVLAVEGISRNHARLERDSAGNWQVTDLGSTNGTFLDELQLTPNQPRRWQPGQVVRVGPYFLRWQQEVTAFPDTPPAGSASVPPAAAPVVPTGGSQMYSRSGQFNVIIDPTSVEVAPGRRRNVQVTIYNQSSTADNFRLQVDGVPAEWLGLAQNSLQLIPGGSGSLPVTFQPPADSSATSGSHEYRLVISSQNNPQEQAVVSGQLIIRPFSRFACDMRPKELVNGGICRVLVRNEGNAPATFTIIGRDPSGAVQFEESHQRLQLAPGQKGTADLVLKAQGRPLLSGGRSQPFAVQVSLPTGEPQTMSGQLDIRPVLPGWLVPLLGVLLLIVCLSGAGLFVFANSRDRQATQTAQAALSQQQAEEGTRQAQLTQTVQAAEADAITATVLAQTAEAAGDDDGDGLSNSLELELGTDPDNADTDGDGLNDGQEENQYGTNPRQQDSDGDALSDGAEVNEHGTSPTNPDTDGDGVPDGVEVAAGDDPLLPPTQTPTPSNTPTASSTPTPPPTHTPTFTPSPSPTPTEEATPTMTASPTPVAPQTVLSCPGTGSGGDFADSRGIRFTVDQSFTTIKVRLDGNAAGNYSVNAELRRSSGFVGPPDHVINNVVFASTGDASNPPYVEVTFVFNEVVVNGSETFTLKFEVNSGPGGLFMETLGIGNNSCSNVAVTNENDVANPTDRSDPPGFEVIWEP